MAKKIKNAIQKMGEWIVKAWDVSKRYVTGSIFIMMVFTAIMSGILLLATSVIDGYAILQGYALMGTCFGTLLSIPLGLLFKLSGEEI